MKLLKQILISDKMQRPIGNRTMLSTKEHNIFPSTKEHNIFPSTTEEPKTRPVSNYCPLLTMDSKKQELNRLLVEYDQLDRRIRQVKQQLEQLGFGQDQ